MRRVLLFSWLDADQWRGKFIATSWGCLEGSQGRICVLQGIPRFSTAWHDTRFGTSQYTNCECSSDNAMGGVSDPMDRGDRASCGRDGADQRSGRELEAESERGVSSGF